MALNKDQEEIYRMAMEAAKKELDSVDEKMQEEIQKARQRLAELQESKKHYRQIYEGTALLLGLEVEPEEENSLGGSKAKDKGKTKEKRVSEDENETDKSQSAGA